MKELRYKGTDGKLVRLAPIPLRERDWVESKSPAQLKRLTMDESFAEQELGRIYRLYERFRAYLQPLAAPATSPGRPQAQLWEVRFPAGSRWKSGPATPSSWQAIRKNFEINKRFPGFEEGGLGQAHTDSLERLDQIKDQADAERERKAEEAISELKTSITLKTR
jgi:hypothetical protein